MWVDRQQTGRVREFQVWALELFFPHIRVSGVDAQKETLAQKLTEGTVPPPAVTQRFLIPGSLRNSSQPLTAQGFLSVCTVIANRSLRGDP